uniref:Uncharacterized protein n=1 Tax=Marseillevirus LCMAC102 TaxID=2506603 RepID=A0A481YV13_9VIRU|nr:MAG: hypothetical protein LCMAC102_01410 [Marseillevirus LCMAC102]
MIFAIYFLEINVTKMPSFVYVVYDAGESAVVGIF